MSKSREWVIEVQEYLARFPPDPLRYYLIAVAPLTKDADFSWTEFMRRNNDELADILGNFIHRALTFTYRFYNHRVPPVDAVEEADQHSLVAITTAKQEVDMLLEKQEFHHAIRRIMDLAATGNRYLNAQAPWRTVKKAPAKAATTLHIATQMVQALAIMIAPFLPFTAERLWALLNLPGSVHRQRWEDIERELPAHHLIRRPEPLFTKIDLTLQ